MKAELESLEQRLEQLLTLVSDLNTQNHALKTRVAQLEAEQKRMREKMQTAAARIADVMERLPHEF